MMTVEENVETDPEQVVEKYKLLFNSMLTELKLVGDSIIITSNEQVIRDATVQAEPSKIKIICESFKKFDQLTLTAITSEQVEEFQSSP